MAGNSPSDNTVKLALINQVVSVIKWITACILIGWLAWLAQKALIKMSDDSDKPPWERILTLVLSNVGTLAVPSGLFYIVFKWGVPVLRRRLAPRSELEKMVDPNRTSSDPVDEDSQRPSLPKPDPLP